MREGDREKKTMIYARLVIYVGLWFVSPYSFAIVYIHGSSFLWYFDLEWECKIHLTLLIKWQERQDYDISIWFFCVWCYLQQNRLGQNRIASIWMFSVILYFCDVYIVPTFIFLNYIFSGSYFLTFLIILLPFFYSSFESCVLYI